MKIRVKFTDPDVMADAVDDAAKELPKPAGVTASEWASICDDRALAAKEAIQEHWMDYGECLDVEFDTDADTATVLPRGSIR